MLAAFYHSSVIRLIPIGLILVGFQETIFVEMRPFGVIVQLLLAFAVACGVAAGPDRGALAGFVLGVMYDLTLGRPLGSSAITFGLGAIVGGWVHLIRVEKRWWLNAIFVTLGAAVGELMVPIVKVMLGEGNLITPALWRIIPVVAIAAGMMSPVLMPLARWTMRVDSGDWKPGRVKSLDSESVR